LILAACHQQSSGFVMLRADRTVSPVSAYPVAVDASKVGTYPPDTKSGAGYFYDDVIEYRVWLHPDNGAAPLNGNKESCVAFAQYERAEAFSKSTAGAEEPIVLVRQREWIDEPTRGQFHVDRTERITEWRVKWLAGNKRGADTISKFLAHPKPAPKEEE
jgi:putative acetyltransferase